MIHLDSSFLIGLAQQSRHDKVRLQQWLREGRPVRTSVIAWAEFLCGPLSAGSADFLSSVVGDPVSFDAGDAIQAAQLYNATGRRARSLADCMIAAVALRTRASVATHDAEHFGRFAPFGLHLTE